MPVFYFNVCAHAVTILDEVGVMLPNAQRAIEEARLAAREMVAEAVLREEPLDGTTIEIRDEHNGLVESVLLSSAVII